MNTNFISLSLCQICFAARSEEKVKLEKKKDLLIFNMFRLERCADEKKDLLIFNMFRLERCADEQ